MLLVRLLHHLAVGYFTLKLLGEGFCIRVDDEWLTKFVQMVLEL